MVHPDGCLPEDPAECAYDRGALPFQDANSTGFQSLYPTLPVSPLPSHSPVSSASSVQSLHSPNRTSFSSLGDSPHEILGSPPFEGHSDTNFMFNTKSPSDHHSNRSHSASLSAPEPSSAGRRKRPLEDEVMEIMGDFKRGRLSDIDDGMFCLVCTTFWYSFAR